ncbi:glycoside hydrolase family 3 N-terminal domain-containing protein [Microbacterium sp. NPDC089698]|uniref:glycoside hydrolase family 3 N-terminal domain-containing protein n=1 Tax=Microbacterium sp. NPDC089698 TaxID=3364200 RepID=UPI0037FF072F
MSVAEANDDRSAGDAETAELERLANAVLWPGFYGRTVPAWLEEALQHGLAGVVYFAQNIGPDLAALSTGIRAANPRALIGVDEEGGSVTRLEAATGSTLPGAAQLGALDDVAATASTGAELARRVRAVGADVVLGPVADVNTDPRNPVIGVRAFGADAGLVSRHVVAAVEGIQAGGVAACVKHFPGHGDTHVDSHHDLPRIAVDPAEIERVHLAPFRAAIAAGVDAVMTAHIVVPAWGEEPATLNPRVLGMLREAGFDGVIITDALDMAAIRETVGIGGGGVLALAAGADLLCIGNPTNPGAAALPDQDEHDYRTARDAIVGALRDGSLSRERVAEAGARVARLAAKLAAASSAEDADTAPYDGAGIVRRALRVRGELKTADAPFVVDARRSSTLAVDSAAGYVSEALAAGGATVRLDAAHLDEPQRGAAVAAAVAQADGRRIALLVDRIDTDPAQRALVGEFAARATEIVAVNVGLPSGDVGVPVIEVGSASRIGAELARERLIGAVR